MASIRKIGDGKTYMAEFFDAAGKRRSFSTKTKNKARAKHVAAVYESVGKGWRQQCSAREYFEKKVTELMEAAGVGIAPAVPFGAWAETWLETLDVVPQTMKGYRATVDLLVEQIGADNPVPAITPLLAQAAIDALAAGSRKKSAGNAATILRRMSKDAHKLGLCSSPFADGVKVNSVKRTTKGLFSYADLEKLRGACHIKGRRESEWKDMLTLLYFTGQRVGDVLGADPADVVDGVWHLTPQKTQKHGTKVVIPLAPEALEVFKRRTAKPMFFLRPGSASSNFRRLLDEAKINYNVVDGRCTHTLHSFRHSMATRLHSAGVDERTRMALLGHTSEITNRGYTQPQIDKLKDAVAKAG